MAGIFLPNNTFFKEFFEQKSDSMFDAVSWATTLPHVKINGAYTESV
jgi:hypothetical protein